MSMLLHVCLPFPLLTPALTKERQTPTAHALRTYSPHASDSLPLPYNFPDEFIDPKLKRISAAEIPSRKPNHIFEAKTRP